MKIGFAMETTSAIRWSPPIRSIFWCALMISLVATRAAGQQADPLQQMQQQLEQLKQQYADTARAFEQRIALLEEQLERQKEARRQGTRRGTVSAAKLAEEAAKKTALRQAEAGAQYQGQLPAEPTYDNLQEADQKIAEPAASGRQFRIPWIFPLWLRSEQRGWAAGCLSSSRKRARNTGWATKRKPTGSSFL